MTNIKLTCNSEMILNILLSCVLHHTSQTFKTIAVIHMLTTAILNADALFGYHSHMAHGPPGTGNCTQSFEAQLKHDSWARLLYLLPRWLLVKLRCKRQLHAREIRGRVDSFEANEWRVLDK